MCQTARWTSDREKMCSISSVISVRVRSLTSGARLSIVPPRLQRRWVRFCLSPFSRYFFLFSRRSSLCCSCASCVSTCSFSARSCSRFFGFAFFVTPFLKMGIKKDRQLFADCDQSTVSFSVFSCCVQFGKLKLVKVVGRRYSTTFPFVS